MLCSSLGTVSPVLSQTDTWLLTEVCNNYPSHYPPTTKLHCCWCCALSLKVFQALEQCGAINIKKKFTAALSGGNFPPISLTQSCLSASAL